MAKIRTVDYLIKKLQDLKITEVFGLPGDYNFNIVEAVEKSENINWIGCTNELNAGYAADGYARIKGYSAIVTTYGVGELSAINAIAGAMAENIPIVKIVGIPKLDDIRNKTLLHHNLSNGDYRAFRRAYSNVVESTAYLDSFSPKYLKKELDRIFEVLIRTKKPIYIALPIDVCDVMTDDEYTPLEIKSNEKTLETAVDEIIRLIEKSADPMITADILTRRFQGIEPLNELLNKTSIPSCAFLRGIDIINSDTPNYLGIYKKDNETAYKKLNESDCIILMGSVISDLNVANFDFKFKIKDTINIQPYHTVIKGRIYKNILLKDVISRLCEKLNYTYGKKVERTFIYNKDDKTKEASNDKLNIDYVYSKLNDFIKPFDNLITEVGLTPFGSMRMKVQKGMTIQNQMLWGSIGWATPCTLGCIMADKSRRNILLSGDGSHQLTAQELATMLRHKLKPIIFIINNSGYTVERILCDNVNYKYNDISKWDYTLLPKVFEGECYSAKVKTDKEFDKILEKIEQEQKTKLCYIELVTDSLEIPSLAYGMVKHPEQLK